MIQDNTSTIDWPAIQKQLDEYSKQFNPQPYLPYNPYPQPCPGCGRCPVCGRGAQPYKWQIPLWS